MQSVQEMLEYVSGVDVKQRGPLGVQADVSIRGGTFEQTLILVDGIKMSDPQTGHHNFDLPFSLDNVERLEILKGQGSRIYGPNAFGGVINIITKKGSGKFVKVKTAAGDFGFMQGDLSMSFPLGLMRNQLTLSKTRSEGYRNNTEFNISKIYYGSTIPIQSGKIDYSFGYVDKEFGAYNFYSNKYPDEWEHTKTLFVNTGAHLQGKRFYLTPKLFWRQHKDDFILDRKRPEFYRNRHTTDVYGIEFQSIVLSTLGSTALGGEFGKERIESSNMGNHSRIRSGFFLEHHLPTFKTLTLVMGTSAYYYSDWDWKVCPGIDFGIQIKSELKLFGSVGKSFRVPTYTELYYNSPANEGNRNLVPEKSWSYETGCNLTKNIYSGKICIFRRE